MKQFKILLCVSPHLSLLLLFSVMYFFVFSLLLWSFPRLLLFFFFFFTFPYTLSLFPWFYPVCPSSLYPSVSSFPHLSSHFYHMSLFCYPLSFFFWLLSPSMPCFVLRLPTPVRQFIFPPTLDTLNSPMTYYDSSCLCLAVSSSFLFFKVYF